MTESCSDLAWAPVVFDCAVPAQAGALAELRASRGVWRVHDTVGDQLRDLAQTRLPNRVLDARQRDALADQIRDGVPEPEYGRWVYYPWSGRLVHTLPPREFRELRLDRNRNKITAQEQDRLGRLVVGIVGLSVGNAIALTLVQEGVCRHLKLADFDMLDLSNLNRIRAGIHDLRLPKTVLAARQIYEVDPYVELSLFSDGLTTQNHADFLSGDPRLDVIVDECDSIPMKFLIREWARALRVPVLMETSDRGMLDVERFDTDPDRPAFHGLVGGLTAEDFKRIDRAERVAVVLDILGAETVSTRMAASMIEIDRTTSTWPQLASDVVLGGATMTAAVRRIGLGQPLPSGRTFIDLEATISGATPSLGLQGALPERGDAGPDVPPGTLPSTSIAGQTAIPELVRLVVEYAALAPSGGNCQPWHFYFGDEAVWLVHDWRRSKNLLDGRKHGSLLALGAAIENLVIAAAHRGFAADIRPFPCPDDESVVAAVRLDERAPLRMSQTAALFPYLRTRVTNRRLAPRTPLGPRVATELQDAATGWGGCLQLITEPDDLHEIGQILGEGDRIRFTCEALHRELIGEVRWAASETLRTRDGIDIATLELSVAQQAAMRLLARPEVAAMIRAQATGSALTELAQQSVAGASAIGMLRLRLSCDLPPDEAAEVHLRASNAASWLDAGRAMQRVWLHATRLGLAFQPMTALLFMLEMLDFEAAGVYTETERSSLRQLEQRLEGVFGERGGGAWAMLFRLAHAPEPTTRALRLPTEWVLHAGLPHP